MQETTMKGNGQRVPRSVWPALPTDIVELVSEFGLACFECGGHVERVEGDLVCVDCGLVHGISYYRDEKIPFEVTSAGHSEGHYNPVNNSNYGKGLGTVIDTRLKAAVLEASYGQSPLRFKMAKNLRVKLDEKLVVDYLRLMNDFCRKHDLDSRHDVAQIRFRDQLGLNLRYMAEYFLKYKDQKHDSWIVVAALFTHLLRDLYPERCRALQGKSPELSLNAEIVEYYEILLSTLSAPLLPSLPSLPSETE